MGKISMESLSRSLSVPLLPPYSVGRSPTTLAIPNANRMSQDSLTMRHKQRWVSLERNKFQTVSKHGTDSPNVVCFANTAQPNLQSECHKTSHHVTFCEVRCDVSAVAL